MFCFYDTTTKHIRLSRDVTWLGKNYGTWKGFKINIIKSEEDDFDDPGEFGSDDKYYEILRFKQMSNQLLLKKSLQFVLHYINFNFFIMTHHKPPLHLKDYDLEGSYLKQTQEGKKK